MDTGNPELNIYLEDIRIFENLIKHDAFWSGLDQAQGETANYFNSLTIPADQTVTFVFGGKSRMLAEVLTEKILTDVKDERFLAAFKERIRLNEVENRHLYNTGASKVEPPENGPIIPNKLLEIDSQAHIFFIDDHLSSGKKAGQVVNTLATRFAEVNFVGLSGNLINESDNQWVGQSTDRIYVPPNQALAYKAGIRDLSRLYSRAVNVRLNKQINDLGRDDSINIDTLDHEIRNKLKLPQKIIQKISEMPPRQRLT